MTSRMSIFAILPCGVIAPCSARVSAVCRTSRPAEGSLRRVRLRAPAAGRAPSAPLAAGNPSRQPPFCSLNGRPSRRNLL